MRFGTSDHVPGIVKNPCSTCKTALHWETVMKLRALLVYPAFSEFSYWNPKSLYRLAGRKHFMPPLGLMTMAALLPADWELSLADLNCRTLTDEEIDAADLIMTGGMITQQRRTLELIDRVRARSKPVVVGGPDATSQPDKYAAADFLVLDEAENTLSAFLAALERGERSGVFRRPDPKPDVTAVGVPRFDLVRMEDYLYPAVQYSRGCPFNCEFCDIIELYGRVPRTKTPTQFIAELDALYNRGYRGGVEIVDDNFIGNKKEVKPMLRALIVWQEERGWPFYFGTEATLTLAQDEELMGLMREAQFKRVFLGIETPDPELLRITQKRQNTLEPVVNSVRKIDSFGMIVSAGLILGFDGEKTGAGAAIVDLVQAADIPMAMFGLLTSVPNTQLERRLRKEGRLLKPEGGFRQKAGEDDQLSFGLNYVPSRPRAEILREFKGALNALYGKRLYFQRVIRFLKRHDPALRYRSPGAALAGQVSGFLRVLGMYAARPDLWGSFLAAIAAGLRFGMSGLNLAVIYCAAFLHFEKQTVYVSRRLDAQLAEVERAGESAYHASRRLEEEAAA
ncbi:MAG: B12-binding domain-containing radical SAM protein [Elusimicrobia bacterium CG_4_10_14_0_2_um_filter_63_34]|nr:MAG: B12-binding domain-containing radical SAM protein [Elusimicrobia bacterium CG_4_10_14_0_2_um_filter_63_34]